MKRPLLIVIIIALALLIAAIVYLARMPRTPEDYLRQARIIERKLNIKITRLESKDPEKNQERIARLEERIVREYEKVISRFPDSTEAGEAEYRLILIADRKGKEPESVAGRYESFIKENRDSRYKRDVLLRLAELNTQELKKPLSAIRWSEEFIKEFPKDDYADDALFQIAKIYEDIHEYQSAVAMLKRLLKQYPESPLADEAQYRIANLLAEKLKDYQEAIDSLKVIEKQPGKSKYVLLARSQRESLEQRILEEEGKQYFLKYYDGVGETSALAQPLEEWNHPVIKQIRESGLDVEHYDIQIELSPGDGATTVMAAMEILATKPVTDGEIILQLNPDLQILSLAANGKKLPFERKEQFVYVSLDGALKKDDRLLLQLHYAGECTKSWKGDVISSRGTHLRPESKWYPMTCAGDGASCDVKVTVPKAFRAVSVGELVSTESKDNLREYHWREEAKVSGITIVAGALMQHSEKLNDKIHFIFFAAPQHMHLAPEYVKKTKEILQFYSSRFGEYPFKKIAIVEAPLFPGGYGAPSVILLCKRAFETSSRPASLLAHELAHQWWGSTLQVALTEDSIPWLSEGFATYSDALYLEFSQGTEAFRKHLRQTARYFVNRSRYSTNLSIRRTWWSSPMYHSLTYEKGALVLHALRYVMGDDNFFAALRRYANEFAFRTVTVTDFQNVCERFYGESLEWFFKEWLDGVSIPHFKITEAIATLETAPDGTKQYRTRIIVRQVGEPSKMPVDVTLYCGGDASERKRVWLDGEEQSVEFSSVSLPEQAVIDEDFWVLSLSAPDELESKIEIVRPNQVDSLK